MRLCLFKIEYANLSLTNMATQDMLNSHPNPNPHPNTGANVRALSKPTEDVTGAGGMRAETGQQAETGLGNGGGTETRRGTEKDRKALVELGVIDEGIKYILTTIQEHDKVLDISIFKQVAKSQ